MKGCVSAITAVVMLSAIAASAQSLGVQPDQPPLLPPALMVLPDLPSVYGPPQPLHPDEGLNNGGVKEQFTFRYLTDDVYRGISHNRASGGNIHASNFQADTQASFDLGKLPHPYVGVFADVDDSDPLSRFQEVRPFFGIEYTLRPLVFNVGYNTYIYPERERLDPSPNTSEFFVRLSLDDSYFFLTPTAVLSPYIYGAYDYQRNKGWYIEAGLKHDFVLEDLGITFTAYGDVAYINNFAQQFVVISPQDSGFQHFDLGLIGNFSLNHLFNFSTRYGDFAVQGYLTYTGKFDNPVLANRIVWGGVGLSFNY